MIRSKRSVLNELSLSTGASETLKIKAQLYDYILKIIQKNKYTPKKLEELLIQPQPRISELLNGKISKVSVEKLLEYLSLLGATISFKVKEKKAA
jgi:predicted XRE-type DNA-binding protein